MFDAKSLIEMMMRGAAPAPARGGQQAGGDLGPLGDLLGGLLGGGAAGKPSAAGDSSGGGGLAEIFGKMMPPGGAAPGAGSKGAPQGGSLADILAQLGGAAGGGPRSNAAEASSPQGGGGLDDLLRNLQKQLGGASGAAGAGGLLDVLGKVLGQATEGVKEGAQKIDQATGASRGMKDATGQSPDEMLQKLKDLIGQNQLGAGAAAGGLGALVLGTKTGRALAGQAIKLGGLALIGGLAYKALQNYQAGKPLITGSTQLTPAPQGSGYESAAVTNDAALLYVRAMIAAAAADGRIDAREQERILGGLKQAGMDAQAEEFLANELNNPAAPADLAQGVSTEQEAVQLYTAARVAIDDREEEEHQFLSELASALGLDDALVQHIDATAKAAA